MAYLNLDALPTLDQYHLSEWDAGIFDQELTNLHLIPGTPVTISQKQKTPTEIFHQILKGIGIQSPLNVDEDSLPTKKSAVPPVKEGSFQGTLMALTQGANRLDASFATYFAALGIETPFPIPRPRSFCQSVVTWDSGNYPPHCAVIPKSQEASITSIFNNLALANIATILRVLVPSPSGSVVEWAMQGIDAALLQDIDPLSTNITSISDIEKFNARLRAKVLSNAYALPNVGDRADWYTDQVFAQQQFVGTNPVTISVAPPDLVKEFHQEAVKQSSSTASFLEALDPKSLYVQDCRYFRRAAGVGSKDDLLDAGEKDVRYGCASVSLFHLNADGVLHPLAIVLDYKETMVNSVVLFNKRLRVTDSISYEATDWPWRYAKLCAQVADWTRHELQVHLTDTHFVEEVTIVAALRSFEASHPVYQLLSPHWLRTLSLNASARNTLVPDIIIRLVGLTGPQAFSFVKHSFDTFDWEGSYVPTNLKRRGFPSSELGLNDKKFHNYAFARNVIIMWNVIKSFVREMLAISYKSDADVAKDADIQTWCDEIRGDDTGRLKSFPEKIQTVESLVDVITMCIHIATNQHTAVNYLQQYYMTFVINKPAALCAPLPKSLIELKKFTEQNLLDSYPINRPAEWLLSSHVPWLLSFRVEAVNSLTRYATSLYKVNQNKVNPTPVEAATTAAAEKFYNGLRDFTVEMVTISKEMDDQTVPYAVLHPDANAVSILI
ncbi:Lipoxygenase [Pluteus cervinus]|uniref:Lipoxygenase n=1 Tax=Pluteus cervinus TaxID=181527 RepID=A0ACD3A3M9_9AGAR|nr:Lipoxygenase [Pluteus cervinus]